MRASQAERVIRAPAGSSLAFVLALGRYAAFAACALLSAIAWAGADSEWVAVTDRSLIVREGSALDFSTLVPHAPAGMHGRLEVAAAGHFEFSALPGTPWVRIVVASIES